MLRLVGARTLERQSRTIRQRRKGPIETNTDLSSAARQEPPIIVEMVFMRRVEVGSDCDAEIAARGGVDFLQESRLGSAPTPVLEDGYVPPIR